MTITLPGTTATTAPTPTHPRLSTPSVPGLGDGVAEGVLATMHSALSACTDLDPDQLASGTARGSTLVELSRIGRETAAALGGEPGAVLTHGPGIVVLRDLLDASLVLSAALSQPSGGLRGVAARPDLVARRERMAAGF